MKIYVNLSTGGSMHKYVPSHVDGLTSPYTGDDDIGEPNI